MILLPSACSGGSSERQKATPAPTESASSSAEIARMATVSRCAEAALFVSASATSAPSCATAAVTRRSAFPPAARPASATAAQFGRFSPFSNPSLAEL